MRQLVVALALLIACTLNAAQAQGLQQAEQAVRKAGYRVENRGGYVAALPLGVLLAVDARSGDGYAKKAFFFYKGRYLGTDTSQPSALLSLLWQNGDTVALMYVLYRPDDPMCCPTGGGAIVRYHWNGARLVPMDPIPSDNGNAALSRR
ncbi:MAG: LppP/LprE family lipoprotein [Candidatus Xenobia bacterium]